MRKPDPSLAPGSVSRICTLPSDVGEPLVLGLLSLRMPADAVIASQMLEAHNLSICREHCAELDEGRAGFLWSLPHIEALTAELTSRRDEQRVR